MTGIWRYLWIGGVVSGVALLAFGSFFIVKGLDAKDEIRAAMAKENVLVSNDAEKFGFDGMAGLPVTDAKTAQAQAGVLKEHSTLIKGSLLKSGQDTTLYYAEMKKDLFVDDAAYTNARNTYLNALNLQNALNQARMGFGVADLAVGSGVVILLIGILTLGIGVPALLYLRKLLPERERMRQEMTSPRTIPLPTTR